MRKPHYAWCVLGALVVFLFMTGAVRFSFGVMFKPMLDDFGWSRTAGSWAYGVNMFCFAALLPISGYLFDRFRTRRLLLVFGLCIALGMLAIPLVQSLWQLIFCYGVLVGIGYGGTGATLLTAVVSRWFQGRTGTLMGVGFAGVSAGQLTMLALISWITATFGWRAAFTVLGLSTLVVLAISLLVIRDAPQEMGLAPEGSPEMPSPANGEGEHGSSGGSSTEPPETPRRVEPEVSLTLRRAMGTASFWLMCVVYIICGSADFLVDLHVVPMILDRGGSLVAGGGIKALMGGACFLGVLLFGWLSDRLGRRGPLSVSFVIRAVIFAMVLTSSNIWVLYAFAVVFGFTFMASAPIATALVGDLYGRKHIALITGAVIFLHHGAGGLGSLAGGFSYDHFGSYRPALVLCLVLAIVASIVSLFIRPSRRSGQEAPGFADGTLPPYA